MNIVGYSCDSCGHYWEESYFISYAGSKRCPICGEDAFGMTDGPAEPYEAA